LTAGSLGIGGEFTYAFNRYLAARAGVHGLPLSISAESNGFPFTADIKLLNGTFQVDYAPFGGRFRISPGLLAYNGLSARAHANVAAGQTFDLNDDTYTSSAIDPIKADASFKFGRNAAPMLTIGWSNLLPSKRFAMPLEIGAVFTGTAKFNFDLSGTACDSHGSCGNIATEPDAQADLNAERAKWRDTLSDIPIYPILSIGFSYRFGGMGAQ
jgi:hypothetical protein